MIKQLTLRRFASKILPAIVSDVDGVVYRGSSAIGNSNKIIPSLLTSKIEGKFKIPFVLLTNGGGMLES